MPASSTGDEALKGSADEEEKVGTSGQAPEDGNAAESSAAEPQDDKKPIDMVDAVRAALSDGKEQSSGSGEEEGKKPEETDPDKAKAKEGEEGAGELTEEEFSALKPKTQARIKQLLKKSEELTTQMSQITPKAEKFDKIEGFCQQANLTREDVNTGFRIMNLMKNDPHKAFEAMTPIYNQLCALVGEIIPDDLLAQVHDNKITMEHARELSRYRSKVGFSESRRKTEETAAVEREQNTTRAKAAEALKTDVATAITKWETQQQTADPDYSLKQSRIMEAIELEVLKLQNAGTPVKSAQEALEMANRVLKKVNDEMKKLRPKKSSVTPIGGTGLTNGSKPAPKSIYDAVSQAVGHA